MSLEHSPTREKSGGRISDIAPVLISDVETAKLLGCSRTTVWRRVKDRTLPQPVKFGNLSRFVLSELDDCIESAKAARDGEAA
jgi:excisionase family DNA binding protein